MVAGMWFETIVGNLPIKMKFNKVAVMRTAGLHLYTAQ